MIKREGTCNKNIFVSTSRPAVIMIKAMPDSEQPSTSKSPPSGPRFQDHLCDQAYYDIVCRLGDEETIVQSAIHKLLHQVLDLEQNPLKPPQKCINIPRRLDPLETRPTHVLHGQVWRWSHLKTVVYSLSIQLVQRRYCFSGEQMEVCLNPYHYKRAESLRDSPSFTTLWASIIYYEKSCRLGEVFSCQTTVIRVNCVRNKQKDNCFNLENVENESREWSIQNTRCQIGEGISLMYINGQIFLELSSDSDLYINSKFHNRTRGYTPGTICKLSPFHCRFVRLMRDEDFHQMLNLEVQKGPEAVYEFSKICTLRISFVQGWGHSVAITETPCWIEVRFLRHLQWLASTLTQMGAPYKLHF